jgi:hypothetical protein
MARRTGFASTHCAAAAAAHLDSHRVNRARQGESVSYRAGASPSRCHHPAGVGIGAALVIGGGDLALRRGGGPVLVRLRRSLDAFGIHAVGGIVGAVLTGVFASVAIGGVEGSITAQLIGIGACAAYALVVSLILLMLISVTIGLRVSEEAEAAGLDVSTHGESVE